MQAYLLLSLLALGSALHLQEEPEVVLEEPQISEEDSNHAILNGKPVFYNVVMGSFPLRSQYALWMRSLREVGKYDGTVVFVTDKPDCIAVGLGADLLGGERSFSDKDVDIYPGTGKGQVHILKVKKTRSIAGIKLHKTKVWHNLELAKIEHPVSSVIYTDTDIVIGSNLKSFMTYEKSIEKKGFTLALFPDEGTAAWEGGLLDNSPMGSVHTGVVVMFPTKHSMACLKHWGYFIGFGSDDPKPVRMGLGDGKSFMEMETESESEEGVAGWDQMALKKALPCAHRGEGILKMPHLFMMLPTEKSMQIGKKAQFVHITNTARWNSIKDDTKNEYFHKWLHLTGNTDYAKHGAQCTRQTWATDEYMLRNNIHADDKIKALKGKKTHHK